MLYNFPHPDLSQQMDEFIRESMITGNNVTFGGLGRMDVEWAGRESLLPALMTFINYTPLILYKLSKRKLKVKSQYSLILANPSSCSGQDSGVIHVSPLFSQTVYLKIHWQIWSALFKKNLHTYVHSDILPHGQRWKHHWQKNGWRNVVYSYNGIAFSLECWWNKKAENSDTHAR